MTISIQTILQNNLPLGYTGSIGYTGSQGAGFTGSASAGYTGSAGISGAFAGLGYTGSGSQGFSGSAGAGYTGSIGYVGSPGQPGLFAGMGYVGSAGSGFVGSVGGFNSLQPINVQTGTSYTIVSTDAGAVVELYNLAPITVTVPPDSSLTFGIGQRIDIVQASLGTVFFTGGLGVVVNVAGGVNYLNQWWSGATLLKTNVNEWLLITPSLTGFTGSGGAGYVGSAGAGYAGSAGGFNSIQPVNIQTGTSYIIQTTDAGNLLEFFNTSTVTVNIPPDSSLNFIVGQRIDVIQRNTGAVFFTGGPGVNLVYPDVNYINVPNIGASLVKTAANEWTLITPSTTGYTGSIGAGYVGSGGLGYVGSVGGFASAQVLVSVTATAYTFQLSDAGDLVQFFNSGTTTVTIPNDNVTFFPIGTRIEMVQRSTGPVFFVGGSGVTVNTPDVNYINVTNITGTVIKTNSNEWLFTGPAPSGYVGSSGSGYVGSIGPSGYSGSVGGFGSVQGINIQTGTTYTIQPSDAGIVIEFFNTATTTVTIPNDAATQFYIGQRIDLVQRAGSVFFNPGVGVNLIYPDVNYMNAVNIGASLIKVAVNEWLFSGPSPTGYVGSSGPGFVGSVGGVGYAGSTGGFASAQVIGIVTATAYTFQLSDAGDLVQFYNASPVTVTVPNDNITLFAVGTRIEMVQRGAGSVFFVGDNGVTVNTPDINYINATNVSATIIKTAANEWLFTGPSPSGYTGSSGPGFVGSVGGVGYAGSLGGFASIQPISIQTGTSYVIQSTDAGVLLEFFNTSTTIVTIPADSSLPFFVGQRIDVIQRGLGQIFFNGGPGVTLITPDVNYLNVPNVGASLIKSAANEWTFTGPAPSGYTGSLGFGYSGSVGGIGYSGSTGGFASAQEIGIVTATSYTFQLSDAGDLVQFFNTATTTVTVPNDSLVNFTIGQRIDILQRSTGAVFFVGAAGVTVNTPDVNYINSANVGASLVKIGVNEWSLTTPSTAGYTGSTGLGFVGSSASGYVGSTGGFASAQVLVSVTATAYTFQLSDAGDLVQFYNSATTTVTVPGDGVTNFPTGTRIDVVQRGIGSVFFVGGSGVFLNYQDINFLNGVNSAGTVIKTNSNEWLWTGPGAAGYTGSQSYTGSVGFIGSRGPQGDPGGYTGSAGGSGFVGSVGAGYTGSASTASGFVGSIGSLGYTGSSSGYTGSSGAFAGMGYAGSAGGFASAQVLLSVTATAYTFQLSDAGDLVQFFNSGTVTVTIAPDSSTLFPIGTRIEMVQRNTGPVFVVGGAGVTVNTPDVNYINVTNVSATVIKTAANEWLFTGPSPSGYTGSIGAGYTGSANAGYVGSVGGFASAQVLVSVTATAYTFQLSDAGDLVQFNNTATITVTVPNDSNIFFPVGTRIDVVQRNSGAVFFVGGNGVTVNTPDVNYLNVTNVSGTLIKTSSNEWLFTGPAPSGYAGSAGAGYTGSFGLSGYSGSVGGFGSTQVINIQTGTSYVIQTADAGSILEFFSTVTNTVNIPADSSLPFSIGQRIDVIQRGLGPVFFVGAAGVTLITPDVNYLNVQNVGASLVKTAANEWTLITPSPSGYTGSTGAGFIGSVGTSGYAGSVGGFASAQVLVSVTATAYTFQLSDAGDLVQFFNTATTTVTIPPDSSTLFPIGTRIEMVQRSIGSIFFVGGAGVTVNTPDVNYINVPNVSATVIKTGINEWLFTGPSPSGYTGSLGSGFTGSVGTLGYAGSVGSLSGAQPLNIQTGTSYSIQTGDAGVILEFFNTATTTVTIPPDSTLSFLVGQRVDILQRSTGAVFFTGGVGVTLNAPDVNYINIPNTGASLVKTAANEWALITPSPTGYTGSLGFGYSGSIGIIGYVGSVGGFASAQVLVSVTATAYTFQLTDAGDLVQFFNTATTTVTVPNDNAIFFPIGTRIEMVQRSTGPVFVVGGAGVNVISPDVNYINVPNISATVIKTGINEWLFTGPSPAGYTGSTGLGFVGSIGMSGYAGSFGGFSSVQPINIQTGTSYVVQTSDAGVIIEFFNSGTSTLTIPADSSLPFLVGQRIDVIQRSTGPVFFTGGPGVTLVTSDVNYINVPNVSASIVKTAGNEWTLITPSTSGYTGSSAPGYTGSTNAGYSGSVGGFASAQVLVSVTATAYTFQLSDAGDLVQFYNSATTTVTVPGDSVVNFSIGTRIDVVQRGIGSVFFVNGSGVTLNYIDINFLAAANSAGTLIKTNSNEWLWTGPGVAGYIGSSGYIGSQGPQGPAGGYSGSQGIFGYTGSTSGYIGSTGFRGSQGFIGSQGAGYTGSASPGYTGSQGPVGNSPTVAYGSGIRNGTSSTVIIDFSTDGLVLIKDPGTPVTISFTNYVPGKRVTALVQSTTIDSIVVTHGVIANQSTPGYISVTNRGNQVVFLEYICYGTTQPSVYLSANYA